MSFRHACRAAMKFFIIHGAYGYPKENWFPWLARELERLGHSVTVPQMPTPIGQTLAGWTKAFQRHVRMLDDDTVMVGHSVGCAFIIRVLEQNDVRIRAGFLVSGFARPVGHPFDKITMSFIGEPVDWEKVRSRCPEWHVINSDNDPYVTAERGRELAAHLGAEQVVVKGAGHFNARAGYRTFPLLRDMIVRSIGDMPR